MPGITFQFSSGVADSIFGNCQEPIASFIRKRGEAFEQSSIIGTLFAKKKSNHFAERYGSLTSMDGFKPVSENGAHPLDGMREGYAQTISNVTWKNSFAISRESIDDAQLIDLRKKPEAFIAGYYRTRERFAAAMYAAAIKQQNECTFYDFTFNANCADGGKLFCKDHPSILAKKAQSNLFKDTLSATSIGAMEARMQNFKDDNGAILDITPDTIVIPNDYKAKNALFEAVGSDKDPDTSNNGFNYHYGRWNMIVCPYLNEWLGDNSGFWMMIDSKANDMYDGAIFQDRTNLEVKSYIENTNDANVWNGYARFSAGYNDWRFAALGGASGGDTLIS